MPEVSTPHDCISLRELEKAQFLWQGSETWYRQVGEFRWGSSGAPVDRSKVDRARIKGHGYVRGERWVAIARVDGDSKAATG